MVRLIYRITPKPGLFLLPQERAWGATAEALGSGARLAWQRRAVRWGEMFASCLSTLHLAFGNLWCRVGGYSCQGPGPWGHKDGGWGGGRASKAHGDEGSSRGQTSGFLSAIKPGFQAYSRFWNLIPLNTRYEKTDGGEGVNPCRTSHSHLGAFGAPVTLICSPIALGKHAVCIPGQEWDGTINVPSGPSTKIGLGGGELPVLENMRAEVELLVGSCTRNFYFGWDYETHTKE